MHFLSGSLVVSALAFVGATMAAPTLRRRQTSACFVPGNVALVPEVQGGVPALAQAVTCGNNNILSRVPEVTSGSTSFSSVNFQGSGKSLLGFALEKFAVPASPTAADLTRIQDALNVYLATEAGLRSISGTKRLVEQVKVPRFFLMFQKARILKLQGVADGQLGDSIAGGARLTSVQHQLDKVLKNQRGSSSAELNQLRALATQI